MKRTFSTLIFLALLLCGKNVSAATFGELMEFNCNVSAAQLDEGQLMLKTGVCMGYFSALTDLLRSRGVVCGIENHSVGTMVELANQELAKNPGLAGEPAHSVVMAVLSAHFLCESR